MLLYQLPYNLKTIFIKYENKCKNKINKIWSLKFNQTFFNKSFTQSLAQLQKWFSLAGTLLLLTHYLQSSLDNELNRGSSHLTLTLLLI